MLREAMGLLVLVAAQAEAPSSVDAAGGTYELSSRARIEALGVCRVNPDGVQCWSRDGTLNADLAKRTEEYLLYDPNLVSFRYGRKNRYVVLKVPDDLYATVSPTDDPNFSVSQGQGADSLHWDRVVMGSKARTFNVFVDCSHVRTFAPVEMAFAQGKILDYQGTRFDVGKTTRESDAQRRASSEGAPPMGPQWYVTWTEKAGRPGTREFTYAPLDRQGVEIQYVNVKGSPIKSAKFDERQSGNGYWQRRVGPNARGDQHASFFVGSSSVPGVGNVYTNIDPAKIAAVRIAASERVKIRFPDLPADPRP